MIAYWNGMTWECSTNQISRLESLATSFSMQIETNADKEGVSPTETVGLNAIEISLSTTYRIETGTPDIKGVISAWKSQIGKAAPLIIGSEIFGPDKVQLQSVDVSNIQMRANGFFTAVTLAFKFKEYIEEPVVVSVSGTRGTAAGEGGVLTNNNTSTDVGASSAIDDPTGGSGLLGVMGAGSAVFVGASASDKISKKTVHIGKAPKDSKSASYAKRGVNR